MNLTELQLQLREIEEHISTLQGEIEKMKPRPEDENKKVYDAINEIACKYPLNNRTFSQPVLCLSKAYISCLSYITLADQENMEEKLLYLCRLAHGMKCFTSAEEVLRLGLDVDKEYFERCCCDLAEVRDSFLTDALIIANLTEEATDATFALIADVARIMDAGKEELRVMALVAKSVLTDNFDNLLELPVPTENCWSGRFKEHIPKSWLKSQRRKCGDSLKVLERSLNVFNDNVDNIDEILKMFHETVVDGSEVYNVNNNVTKLKSGSIVRKGDVLVKYDVSKTKKLIFPRVIRYSLSYSVIGTTKKQIVAPCDGVLFLVEDKTNDLVTTITAYVCSYFDDYAEVSKHHYKSNGGKS